MPKIPRIGYFMGVVEKHINLLSVGLMTAVFATAVTISSCSKKDKDDCYSCSLDGENVSFCYTEGNDFYTLTISGETQEVPLNGQSWSSVKASKKAICEPQ